MNIKKNTFPVNQIYQLEIGRNGNIMSRLRDLDEDSTLQNSLLGVLYPEIRIAIVLVPVGPLTELEESRVRNTMGNFWYKGIHFKLAGGASSTKEGLFYFVDVDHSEEMRDRFRGVPQAAVTYFGTLVSNCRFLTEVPDARILVVPDHDLGTNDCKGWIRESLALSSLGVPSGGFYQFRFAVKKWQAKGALKVMKDDVADLLDVDLILPESSIKPGLKAKHFRLFGNGRRFREHAVLGVREISRRLEFEPSYTLTQHAPGDSILKEIEPPTTKKIQQVSEAVGDGRYEDLLKLIGHNPNKRAGEGSEEEVYTIEGLLLADKSGHIVKHPWVNAQLDKLLARWTFKACTGGVYRLPGFALSDDGYLVAVDGKVFHGSDWIPENHSISALTSKRGLCVRYPVRMYEDLLPTKHMSSTEVVEGLRNELLKQGCPNADKVAEEVAKDQILLEGTYTLHSETAKLNGGDFDFDLVGVIEEDQFPIWVADRFALKNPFQLTKTKQQKVEHPWWNIVHVARKAVGNQIGAITDLITSCLAADRKDLSAELVRELQNALDSLKWGVEPDQKKIAGIRQQVSTAPWLRFKHERKVSDLPNKLDVASTDKIGLLWNQVRPCFDDLLTPKLPLEAFAELFQGETITDSMLEECHYVNTAYGFVVANIVQYQADLKAELNKAKQEWDDVRQSQDKELRKQKLFAKNKVQSAHYFSQERAKDEMKAITSFVKIWAQNKTKDRVAWAQCLNSIICKGKGTGSLLYIAFPQEAVTHLAAREGGENIHLYRPRMVEGWERRDRDTGRVFIVEAVKGGLKETLLFTCKDGKLSLDDTTPEQEPPKQLGQPAQAQPLDDGLGHDIEEVEIPTESVAVDPEVVPF
jgi:hypothetical protein